MICARRHGCAARQCHLCSRRRQTRWLAAPSARRIQGVRGRGECVGLGCQRRVPSIRLDAGGVPDSSRRQRRSARGQSRRLENLTSSVGRMNHREDSDGSATGGALKHVNREHPAHQLCPRNPGQSTTRRVRAFAPLARCAALTGAVTVAVATVSREAAIRDAGRAVARRGFASQRRLLRSAARMYAIVQP